MRRVAIVDEGGNPCDVLSQGRLLSFIYIERELWEMAIKQKVLAGTVSEWGFRPSEVTRVYDDDAAIAAFEAMDKTGYFAVAVCDRRSGRIVGSISAADLHVCLLDEDNDGLLDSPVTMMKASCLDFLKAAHDGQLPPVPTVTAQSNFVEVFDALQRRGPSGERCYRVFLVDSQGRPQAVISLKDALHSVLRKSKDPDGDLPSSPTGMSSWAAQPAEAARQCRTLCTVELDTPSLILQRHHVVSLWMNLPAKLRHHDWRLLYSTTEDGTSTRTLMAQCGVTNEPCLTVVQDSNGRIFGCLTTDPWRVDRGVYGLGQAFVFTFPSHPGSPVMEPVQVFGWTHKNDIFQSSTTDSISIGGGGDGHALWIGDGLRHGSSHACETFDNACLASTEEFQVVAVEVYGLGWRKLPTFAHRKNGSSGKSLFYEPL